MRNRSFILLAALLALLVFGAVGVYAYDASRDDTIATGVTVAGVDVGGMKTAKAREAVAQQVAAPLNKPLRVRYGKHSFTLDPRRAGVKADVDGMVQEALDRSRKGNIVSRVTRNLTGGKVNADIPARVTYDEAAVEKLVKRVQHGVNRPAKDATVDFSGTGVTKVKGRSGVAVRTEALHQSITGELVHPSPERAIEAQVTKTKPKVASMPCAWPCSIE